MGGTVIKTVVAPPPAVAVGADPRPPTDVSHGDPMALAQVEMALARHLGPVATVMVRRAVRNCSDLQQLYAGLARHVTNPAARSAFLATAARAAGGLTKPPTNIGSLALAAIGDTLVAQSSKLLARHAGVVAKRGVGRAVSREAYFADAVSEPKARLALRAELDRLP